MSMLLYNRNRWPPRKRRSDSLAAIPNLVVSQNVLLSGYTRFGIGGPADGVVETTDAVSLTDALKAVRASGVPYVVIGGGTNLIVADAGFRGIVLKFGGHAVRVEGTHAIARRWRGAAGLRGHDCREWTRRYPNHDRHPGLGGRGGLWQRRRLRAFHLRMGSLRFDFSMENPSAISTMPNASFTTAKAFSRGIKTGLSFGRLGARTRAMRLSLRAAADKILAVRNKKYPPTMKCAGSIFKNYLTCRIAPERGGANCPECDPRRQSSLRIFPGTSRREGNDSGRYSCCRLPRQSDLQRGPWHGARLVAVITELKSRIETKFQMPLEEEVQYVGQV